MTELRTEVGLLTPSQGYFPYVQSLTHSFYYLAPNGISGVEMDSLYRYKEISQYQEDHLLHSSLCLVNANAAILHH